MKLINNANQASKMWSVRLAIISAILAALEASLPLWEGVVPDGAFAAASTIIALCAGVARVIKQSNLS